MTVCSSNENICFLTKSRQESIELAITVTKPCSTNAIKRNWAVTYQSYQRETLDGPEQMRGVRVDATPLHLLVGWS